MEKYFKSLIPIGLKYAEVTANILWKSTRKKMICVFSFGTVNDNCITMFKVLVLSNFLVTTLTIRMMDFSKTLYTFNE